jgi:hypothetical protein
MEIKISGKFENKNRSLYTQKEIDEVWWIGEGFVFVQYLTEDIFLGDVFVLEDRTEITLRQIKLQFNAKESLTMMSRGWKCLCKFDNLNLDKIPAVKDWFHTDAVIIARRK